MDLPSGFFIMIGAVSAGLITAIVSLVSLIIAKEQKITEYREARRVRVRTDTASFLAHIDTLFDLYEAELNKNNQSELNDTQLLKFRTDNKEFLCVLSEMRHRMYLRESPHKEKELKKLLTDIELAFKANQSDKNALLDMKEEIIKVQQMHLKEEWERIKDGENTYRKAKSIAKYSMFVALVALLVLISLGLLQYFGAESDGESKLPQDADVSGKFLQEVQPFLAAKTE